jgi:hypothetical protein
MIVRPAPEAGRPGSGEHPILLLALPGQRARGYAGDLAHRDLGEHGRGDGLRVLGVRWGYAHLHDLGPLGIFGQPDDDLEREIRIDQGHGVAEVRELSVRDVHPAILREMAPCTESSGHLADI